MGRTTQPGRSTRPGRTDRRAGRRRGRPTGLHRPHDPHDRADADRQRHRRRRMAGRAQAGQHLAHPRPAGLRRGRSARPRSCTPRSPDRSMRSSASAREHRAARVAALEAELAEARKALAEWRSRTVVRASGRAGISGFDRRVHRRDRPSTVGPVGVDRPRRALPSLMPEGDTVHLAGKRLRAALAGQLLVRGELRHPRLVEHDLAGRPVLDVAVSASTCSPASTTAAACTATSGWTAHGTSTGPE